MTLRDESRDREMPTIFLSFSLWLSYPQYLPRSKVQGAQCGVVLWVWCGKWGRAKFSPTSLLIVTVGVPQVRTLSLRRPAPLDQKERRLQEHQEKKDDEFEAQFAALMANKDSFMRALKGELIEVSTPCPSAHVAS